MKLLSQITFGAIASLFGMSLAHGAPDAPRIGVQLWSVKDEIKQDFEGTLGKIAQLGFQGVEFAGDVGRFGADPAGLKALLAGHGLACAGAHVNFAALAPDKFESTVAFYHDAGCRNLVISMDKRGESAADSAQMAQELSALAARLKPRGMRIGYHNHAPEMAGAPGKTPWDVLAKNTPKDTILQQDVGWTTYAGKDPVALVRQYPGRTVSTHFKAKFVKGDSGTPIIGMDRTDWAGLTRAVRAVGGTEWIIIEQEEYPNGMGQLESVAASLRGLQTVIAKIAAK
ncbi:MAG: sugar phosphate isomerase/epimerase [Massilia sp.]